MTLTEYLEAGLAERPPGSHAHALATAPATPDLLWSELAVAIRGALGVWPEPSAILAAPLLVNQLEQQGFSIADLETALGTGGKDASLPNCYGAALHYVRALAQGQVTPHLAQQIRRWFLPAEVTELKRLQADCATLLAQRSAVQAAPRREDGLPKLRATVRRGGRSAELSRVLRYEAFGYLAREVHASASLAAVAVNAVRLWKYCANALSWRLLCPNKDRIVILDGTEHRPRLTELTMANLPACDAELLQAPAARRVTGAQLQELLPNVARSLRPAGVGELAFIPAFHGGRVIAMICVAAPESGFTALDMQFNQKIGQLLSTRVLNLIKQQHGAEQLARAQIMAAEAEQLRSTMNSAAMGMAVVRLDTCGTVQFANRALLQLLHPSAVASPPAPPAALSQLVAAEDRPRVEELLAALRNVAGKAAMAELDLCGEPGRRVPVQLRASVMRSSVDAQPLGIVQVIDLTEWREIERIKREFTATVSHELLTPLTAIIGANGILDAKFAKVIAPAGGVLIKSVGRNADRLLKLVRNLLEMEQIDSGHRKLSLAGIPVGQSLVNALQAHQESARRANVTLQLGEPLPAALVLADGACLQQVLAQLLSNAIKFAPKDTMVELLAQVQEADARVEISVVDRGPGVPPHFHSSIFGRFIQADSSERRAKGGIGLGLRIAKTLTELMRGEIGFDSEPGLGSRFWIRLPLAAAPEAAAALPTTPHSPPPGASP